MKIYCEQDIFEKQKFSKMPLIILNLTKAHSLALLLLEALASSISYINYNPTSFYI
jgi:hypothetical protein